MGKISVRSLTALTSSLMGVLLPDVGPAFCQSSDKTPDILRSSLVNDSSILICTGQYNYYATTTTHFMGAGALLDWSEIGELGLA